MGVWIEMTITESSLIAINHVAPHMGVWIEIDVTYFDTDTVDIRRSPHGSVD